MAVSSEKPGMYKELEDILACSLCLDRCTQPRSLPCLHTYCSGCLNQLIQKSGQSGKFQCPNCRMEVPVPPGGAADFPGAFLLNAVGETVDKFKELGLPQNSQCTLCLQKGKVSSAHSFCTDCMKVLCEDCLDTHNMLLDSHNLLVCANVTSDDLNVILTKKVDTCPKHANKKIELYCESCSELLCLMCSVLDHATHTKLELESAVQGHRCDLEGTQEKLVQKVQYYEECLENVNKTQKDVKADAQKQTQVIQKHGAQLLEKIQMFIQQATDEVQSQEQESFEYLESLKENINYHLTRLSNCVRHIASTLKHGNMSTIIKTSTKEKHTYESMLQELGTNLDLPKMTFDVQLIDVNQLESANLIGAIKCNKRTESLNEPANVLHNMSTSQDQPGTLVSTKISQFAVPYLPRGVAYTKEGDIVVCENHASRVFVYKPDGQKLTQLATSTGTLATDVDCTDDCIVIPDKTTGSVLVFNTDGSFRRSIGVDCKQWAGICISKQDNIIFVARHEDNTVETLNLHTSESKQTFLKSSPAVPLKGPQFVTADTRLVVVACFGSKSVCVFDRSGNHQFTYTGQSSEAGKLTSAWGVVIDRNGRLLVSDFTSSCIHVVSGKGYFLGQINLAKDSLWKPIGLAINSHGHLTVTCFGSRVIATYEYGFQ